MRAHKIATLLLIVLVFGAAAWFGFQTYRQAEAQDVPAPANDAPAPAPAPDDAATETPPASSYAEASGDKPDARIALFKDRGDGARLIWSPGEGESVARASFIDNATLILSASSTDKAAPFRMIALDLASGTMTTRIQSSAPTSASAQRPGHQNADALCYSQWSDNAKQEIWCANFNGKNPRRLTTHDGNEDLVEPSISPDGNWVAFEVNTDRATAGKRNSPGHGSSAIWKIGLNGSGLQQLTRGSDDRFPTWSADSRTIYFQRRLSDGSWDMYSIFADGTNPGPVLQTYGEDELWPTLRADAKEAVFSDAVSGGMPRLRLLDLRDNSGQWLTSGAYGPETHPSVSPDGKLAVFLAPVDPAVPGRLGVWATELDR